MTVVNCYIGGHHYKTIPRYEQLPSQVAALTIPAIAINSAYTSCIMVRYLMVIIYSIRIIYLSRKE